MPMFFFISGYLLNFNKLKENNFFQLFDKYKFRLIIPWMVAVSVFFLIRVYTMDEVTLSYKSFFASYIFPFYHLWYVPCFLFFLFLTLFLIKLKVNLTFMLLISLLVYLAHFFITNKYYLSFNHVFRLQYYFYFVFGFYLVNKNFQKTFLTDFAKIRIGFLILFILNGILFYNFSLKISPILFLLQNILLAGIIVNFISLQSFSYEALTWLGKNSLGIYLWHVIPIIVGWTFINNLSLYYGVTMGLLIISGFCYYFLVKFAFFRTYFFGLS